MKMNTIKEFLKPGSRRWKEFINVLSVVTNERNCDHHEGTIHDAILVRSDARAIMQAMGGVDIDATLKYFDERGGFCDVEILWNCTLDGIDSERDDDDDEYLTDNEMNVYVAAMEALRPLEPLRAKVDSHRRIREARNALKPLLESGLTADEFRSALSLTLANF
jgi:hypothetical protein